MVHLPNMSKDLHSRKYLKEYRRDLRNNGTAAEATLWKSLQRKQLDGRKFRRQHSVGNYIVDFFCYSENLAIEVDGPYHFTSKGLARDKARDEYLNSVGIKVIRFKNSEVFESLEMVLEKIKQSFNAG